MEDKLRILLVEDSATDADLLVTHLKREQVNFEHKRVWTKEDFVKTLYSFMPDVVIADHNLPGFNGMEIFELLKKDKINVPFILVTGSVSEKLLIEYAKEGIDDYILKGNLLRLPSAIESVVNKKKIVRLHTQLLRANEELENVYSDLKNSINYASKIQNAMLPEPSGLQDVFPKSFIFFKPKDILSGDFYWYEKKNQLFLVAVADCTGHGVPGALLSMMGNDLLMEAVNIRHISQPSQVLDRMNGRVRKILKHDTSEIRDGMDLAFCVFDLEKNTLAYAGAKRPVYLIRDRKLIELKPDKMAIGEPAEPSRTFTNHEMPLLPGDRIFLFSDGYADQFNGITDKKMMRKRFSRLILHTSHIPITDQANMIMSFFDEWKDGGPQTDDALVIGIEI